MLELIATALMMSQSYRTDSAICHIAQPNAEQVSQVCLADNGIATIEYSNGQQIETNDSELIAHLQNM